ncbi:MAG: leucine-rich repeat domain-containing protein, partial [Bacteroidota bacterium]
MIRVFWAGILLLMACGTPPQHQALSREALYLAPTYNSIKEANPHLDSVYKLNLYGEGLIVLPEEFISFQQLQWLDLSENYFQSWGDVMRTLSKMPHLEVLHSQYNTIRIIEPEIGQLAQLKELYLDHNRI